ncbi:hypothetical protein [Acanthopleuribacter pedis]|uniref:Thiaminase-2/PQQC domain-containing protein n=1 Tax=Acanthopleuribacter pedis TaxID=442870 RepID=A0A8J7QG61_9BACT|nr:hypothetical protein [Acanthopleuribacter pedis]MBO1319430.1 hypothetical protein [Acanthopleuribacter pedis]
MNAQDRARAFPVFRENVWLINPATETSLLITSSSRYEVPEADARKFLKMRSYCTGFQSQADIAAKSGLTVDEVDTLVCAMAEVDVLRQADDTPPDIEQVRTMLQRGCALWAEELYMMNMGNQFMSDDLPPRVFMAWLVELVHFYRALPGAFLAAARASDSPALAPLLQRYAERTGRRVQPLLETLANLGVSRDQVDETTPMMATRLADFLMRELFETLPAGALAVAALIEACALDAGQCEALLANATHHYGWDAAQLGPFLSLQQSMIDEGQGRLLAENLDLIHINDRADLNRLTNQLHDLVHVFFLLSDELRQYYRPLHGKYLFRKPMKFADI